MTYYLRHYFDPDMNHLALKPKESDGESDVYNLGYVQNVIKDQVVAEIVPFEQAGPNPDERFILKEPVFPLGPNTHLDPENSRYLKSDINGYVFYLDGKITVKHVLNVRSDVSFQTGNIFFVGDMAVHGSVRAGFQAQANAVRVMGMVEGGRVRSRGDMLVEAGARGSAGGKGRLIAGGRIVCPFVEKLEVRAGDAIVIEKYCLYSTLYVGTNLVVKGSLYGSTVNAYGSVYVGAQLGNKAAVPTKIYLGYSPQTIRELEKLDAYIANVSQRVTHLSAIAGHLPPETPNGQRLQRARNERQALLERRDELWSHLYVDEERMQNCRLIVPGIVHPGVEISIGKAYMLVERQFENVCFRLSQEDIIVVPNTAAGV